MPIRGAVSGGGGGASVLDDLLDVSIVSPTNGDLLQYNGINWINGSYSHNFLSGLTVGDPHSQYLYLAGRAGGQTIQALAVGENTLDIKAVASQTGDLLRLLSSSSVPLITFRRANNAGGGDVGWLNIVTPTGKNSGSIILWLDGVIGSGKFAEQYYNATDDAYYTLIVGGTAGKVVFGNFSVVGGLGAGGTNTTFTLSPTDKGRFGINTTNPGATFDVWYNGASIFSVNNAGTIIAVALSTSGNILATGAISTELFFHVNSGGVTNLSLSTDGFNDFLDITLPLLFRDTIGGGGAIVGALTKTGKLRLGDGTIPVHRYEAKAGTATVAPLKIDTGSVVLTVAIPGVIETDDVRLYYTQAGPTRKTVAYTDDIPVIPDPPIGSYAPGSFTIATGKFVNMVKRLILTGAQRLTMQGDSRLVIAN